MSPLALKLASAVAASAAAYSARAWIRRVLDPRTLLAALSFRAKLALFLMFPMWFGSFALCAVLFGALFSEGLAAYVVKNVPAATKAYAKFHPALKDGHEK